jgi:protein TIF31
VPIIKDSSPRSTLAEEALEAGKISLAQNQKKLGQELLLESLSLHEQIYGILHPEVAQVYHTLSMLYYQLEEKEAAVELARKAVIVSERTVGVDSQETLLDYLNLSLFLHQLGDSKTALEYAKHALDLWKIIYGPDHPDTITTINNAAVMLQHLKAYHESRRWFEESLRVCEKVFGKQSVNSATLLFQLAQALALDHEPREAVNRMRESYNIFLQELGPADKNTKEAEGWLEQLTQNAVSIAKHAKDVQARRLRAGIRFTPRSTSLGSTTAGASLSGAAKTSEVDAKPAIDSRSIDELIKFIEGTDKQKKSAGAGGKKNAARKNPKARRNGAVRH